MNTTWKKVLMTGAACAILTGSAMAQVSPGFEGTGEVPRAFPGSGGAELSDRGIAATLPQADMDEVGRDLDLDPEKMRESFATISRSAGGEVTRQPPTEDVLRTLGGIMDPNSNPSLFRLDRSGIAADDRV